MTSIEILLVEDNIFDAELTISSLKKSNLANNIVHVADGAEALDLIFHRGEYADSKNGHPKLILLDLKMPRVSGLEVLAELKAHDDTRQIPVVVLTSSSLDPDIEASYKLGVNSYIIKPVGFEEFVKAVAGVGVYWMMLNQPPMPK